MNRFVIRVISIGGLAACFVATFPSKIAFLNTATGYICTMDSNGTNVAQVDNTFNARHVAYAPDGSKLAFDTENGGGIYTINVTGSGVTNISNVTYPTYDKQPSFSPSGDRVVFASNRWNPGSNGYEQIYVMNVNGTGVTRLTFSGTFDQTPRFGPDGTQIVFRRSSSGIWIMSQDGTNQHQIAAAGEDPTFSPDGTTIAFSRGNGIWTMDMQGGSLQRLTQGASDLAPCYSPSGRQITFDGVSIMNSDGSNQQYFGGGIKPCFPLFGASFHVSPAGYSLPRGIVLSGNLQSLVDSDDDYLFLRPGVVLSSLESPVQFVADAQLSVISPELMTVTVESGVNSPNLRQIIEVYNFSSASWQQFDTRLASLSDTRIQFSPNSPEQFINASDGLTRAKIRWRQSGPILSYPWIARVDQIAWLVYP